MNQTNNRKRDRFAWSAVAVLVVICSALSFSTAGAYAQGYQGCQPAIHTPCSSKPSTIFSKTLWTRVDPLVLYEGAMKGSVRVPWGSLFIFPDRKDDERSSDTTTGKFGGLGLYINKPVADPKKPDMRLYVDIVSPIEDTPGWRAGIMPGDQITHIDGEPTEPLVMDEVLKRLRGTPGTTVTITILRVPTSRSRRL
jgi:carboxyl-terminal processing protease